MIHSVNTNITAGLGLLRDELSKYGIHNSTLEATKPNNTIDQNVPEFEFLLSSPTRIEELYKELYKQGKLL